MIRTFAALPIPSEVARDLIRPAVEVSGRHPRWIDGNTAHLTLAFLGSLSHDDVTNVASALAEIRQAPFDMQLAKADAFPSRKSPKVVVVEPSDSDELRQLYDAVRSSLAEWLPRHRRTYRPHVTLARCKRRSNSHTTKIVQTIDGLLPRSVAVTEFVLYRSRTEPDRAYYDVIQSFELVG